MQVVLEWCGFLGAWLLVIGPVYQAAIELREAQLDRDRMNQIVTSVQQPPRVSNWWWLLPPILYLRTRRSNKEHQKAVMDAMSEKDREDAVSFMNKATGWFTVAGGGVLLAAAKTYELIEAQRWPVWLFPVIIVIMLFVAAGNTAIRMARGDRMIHPDEAERRAVARREARASRRA